MNCSRAWLAALRRGAWFALQVPGNFGSPSHSLMRELAESPAWAARLDGVLRHDDAVAEPARYLDIMLRAGCAADAWETTYLQVLPGDNAVYEWVRGTALRPVLAALSREDAAEFEAGLRAAPRRGLPVHGVRHRLPVPPDLRGGPETVGPYPVQARPMQQARGTVR